MSAGREREDASCVLPIHRQARSLTPLSLAVLTFMKIRNPSKAFRLLVIATQGVFFNMFFLAYLISPRAAHRFVAYLEEEAVRPSSLPLPSSLGPPSSTSITPSSPRSKLTPTPGSA